MNNLEKNLFESIDQLIDAKLNQISFDKTITATIIDDSNADKNQYYVQSGNDKFYAYANGGVYVNGSQVYVTIPQGDYSMKKLIIGAYDSDKFDEEVLTSPLKRMVNISGNLLSADSADLITDPITTIGSAFTYDPTKFDVGVPVKYLGFSATITTSGINEAVRGNYGFAIVKSKEDDGYEWSDFLYSFDCTQFLGNPYNYFDPGFKQEIVFDASVIDKATELKLIFYHRDNFQKADGTPTSTPGFTLKDLLLCYGPSAEDYKTSKDKKELVLWSETNGYTVKGATSSQIDIRAKWIHEDPDEPGTYITKENKDIESNGVSLTLYRYMPGIEDLGAGPHWAKAVKKTYAANPEQTPNGKVGPVTPLPLQIKDRGDYYTFPYTNNGTSAWQTKLETTGKADVDSNNDVRVDWAKGTGVDLILVPFKDAVNSREDFKAVLEKTTKHSEVKCMIMEGVTISLSLGQENIVPGTIQLTSAKKNGDTITEVVFNEKNKTIKIGSNTERSITINYEKGTIKLANGGKFIEKDDNEDQTVEYELYFEFNSSIKITSNTLSFAKVEEGGDTQTPGDRNAELTFFYHKDAKYKGVYQIYGYDQEILDNQLGYKDEEIWVQFADGTSKFKAGDIVKFWIPKIATMLLPPKDTTWDSLTWSESKETNDNWHVYEHTISADKTSLKLHYRVKQHYSRNANNNTIKCTVNSTKKEAKDNTEINVQQAVISGTKDLEFRMMGSSGTDYTLVIDMYKCFKQNIIINGTMYAADTVDDNLPALGIYCSGTKINSDDTTGTAANQTDKNIFKHFIDVVLKAKLYDPNGQEISLENTNITWSLASTMATNFMAFNSNWGSKKTNQCAKLSTISRRLDFGHPVIAKASIPWTTLSGHQIKLEAFVSIPIIRFPTSDNWVIPADIDKLIPTPMQGPTRIIYNNQGKIPIYLDEPLGFKYRENVESAYRICNPPTVGRLTFGHIIKETINNNSITQYKYKPPETLTVKDIKNNVNDSGNFVSDIILMENSSSNIVWAQRVILERNPYSLSGLRDWNGDLTIDSAQNRILANSIAAGKMSENKFTGVIMGEIGKFDDIANNQFGVFGYKNGTSVFRLDQNGNAYFEGTIEAGKGHIAGWNIEKSPAILYCNKYIDKEEDGKGNTLNINTTYSTALRAGTESMAFAVYSKEGNHSNSIPSKEYGWGYEFYVSKRGKLYAKNAEITGDITATSIDLGDNEIPQDNVSGLADFVTNTKNSLTTLDKNISSIQTSQYEITTEDATITYTDPTTKTTTTMKVKKITTKDGDGKIISITYKDNNNNVITNVGSNGGDYQFIAGNGIVLANNAVIQGTIYANAGAIGGFVIDDNYLQSVNQLVGMSINENEDDGWAFWAGYKDGQAKFRVAQNGDLYATSGRIGNWNLSTFKDYNDWGSKDEYPNALHSSTSTSGSGYRVFLCARPSPNDTNVFFGIKKYTNINPDGISTPNYTNTGDKYGYVFNITYDGKLTATAGTIASLQIGSPHVNVASGLYFKHIWDEDGDVYTYMVLNSNGFGEYEKDGSKGDGIFYENAMLVPKFYKYKIGASSNDELIRYSSRIEITSSGITKYYKDGNGAITSTKVLDF